jgi:hypothetical protein
MRDLDPQTHQPQLKARIAPGSLQGRAIIHGHAPRQAMTI